MYNIQLTILEIFQKKNEEKTSSFNEILSRGVSSVKT